MKHAPLIAIAGLALMACSPSSTDIASTTPPAASTPATPQSEPAPPAPATPPATAEDTCNMAQYMALVGKPATDPGVPAPGPTVRLIRPGTQVTMEFSPTRLDVEINDKGVITGLRCG